MNGWCNLSYDGVRLFIFCVGKTDGGAMLVFRLHPFNPTGHNHKHTNNNKELSATATTNGQYRKKEYIHVGEKFIVPMYRIKNTIHKSIHGWCPRAIIQSIV